MSRVRNRLVLFALFILLVVGATSIAGTNRMAIPDDRFITYRFTENLINRGRFTFNQPGDDFYAPPFLDAITLSPGVLLQNLPAFDMALNTLFLALNALLLYVLLEKGLGARLAMAVPVLFLAASITWQSFYSSEQAAVALALSALIALRQERKTFAGILIGLATLIMPEFLILAGILATRHPRRFTLTLFVLIGMGLVCTFVWRLPWQPLITMVAVPAPVDIVTTLTSQNITYFGYLPLFLLGLRSIPDELRPIAAWGSLHLLVSWLLLGTLNLLPVWVAMLVTAMFGLRSLVDWRRVPSLIFLGLLTCGQLGWLLAPPVQSGSPQADAGQWIAANTPPGSLIGTHLTGRLAYLSKRMVVDVSGRLDPAIARSIRNGDWDFAMLRDLPDYLVVQERSEILIWQTARAGWFSEIYRPVYKVSNLTVYQRTVTPGTFKSRPLDHHVAEGLRLTAIAQDMSSISLGSWVRFRLDWNVRQSPEQALQSIELVVSNPPDQRVGYSLLPFTINRWQTGTFSTYHMLRVQAETLPVGLLPLQLQLNYATPGTPQVIAQVKTKPPIITLTGDLYNVDFRSQSGQTQLRAISNRYDPDAQEFVVNSIWQSAGSLAADYRVFVHLYKREDPGRIVGQSDGAFIYPTTTWENGDVFTNQRRIVIRDIAPGIYTLAIGLYATELGRMVLPDGVDRFEYGRISIGADHNVEVLPFVPIP